MPDAGSKSHCVTGFIEQYGEPPQIVASAPGRLEVLGNHTDYNGGLALSCAVRFRCFAAISPLDQAEVRLASTAFDDSTQVYPLDNPVAGEGHWTNYVLGLVAALQQRGHAVPGFSLLIDSAVPGSAGLSSSSAVEMSVLFGLVELMRVDLSPLELAEIGQHAESAVVGAQTGLLDQLTALLGEPGHLLAIDFASLKTKQHAMPKGWCFVAVDSGVKHDLTQKYNQRRASCERAAAAMGVSSLRAADDDLFNAHRSGLSETDWRCARHIINENARVRRAEAALQQGDMPQLGQLMFESHESSRDDFCNSCEALDDLVRFAQQDNRCIGARLSGGGFGGITIHLVHEVDAESYLRDMQNLYGCALKPPRWGAVCRIDSGARLES